MYVMSYLILLMDLWEHVDSMVSKFWWRRKQGERKILVTIFDVGVLL